MKRVVVRETCPSVANSSPHKSHNRTPIHAVKSERSTNMQNALLCDTLRQRLGHDLNQRRHGGPGRCGKLQRHEVFDEQQALRVVGVHREALGPSCVKSTHTRCRYISPHPTLTHSLTHSLTSNNQTNECAIQPQKPRATLCVRAPRRVSA